MRAAQGALICDHRRYSESGCGDPTIGQWWNADLGSGFSVGVGSNPHPWNLNEVHSAIDFNGDGVLFKFLLQPTS
jgi:hypothetical protein